MININPVPLGGDNKHVDNVLFFAGFSEVLVVGAIAGAKLGEWVMGINGREGREREDQPC